MMKKLIFILFFLPVLAFGQNRFPSIDSAKNYVLRYVKNSAVESFTNLRMQNVTYGTLQLIDSLCGSGVIDTIWKSGDTLKYRIGSQTVTVGVIDLGTISIDSSYTLDFPSTNNGTHSDLSVTLNGAVLGDVVVIGVPNGSIEDHSLYSAWVSAANTITIRFNNYGSGNHNPAEGVFKIKLLR